MPTCLYCRETKDASAFNREHVVPEAFGKFENNFVLNDIVCEACNTYFGNHLDIQLARDSIEGFDRYEHGVKRPSLTTNLGRSPRLSARVNDGGFFDGAEVRWGASEDGCGLELFPIAQFGVSDASGLQAWFPKDALPTRQELHAHGFAPEAELSIKPFGVAQEDAERLLLEKGYSVCWSEVVGGQPKGSEIDIHVAGTIDSVLQRAVAKMACNYLAYHYAAIAMMPQFDEVRRYVRYGEQPASAPVTLAENEFLAGVSQGRVPLAHGLGVSWKTPRVIGQVTLFFRFHYRVILASGGFLIPPTVVARGHLFDPINRQILDLTTDPRRGRPVSPR